MSIEAMKQDFETWWHNEGSQSPFTHHDAEEHCKRMCEIAWSNGAYKAIADLEKQEPVVVVSGTPFYTSPPARQPLTDEQELRAFEAWCFSVGLMAESYGIRSESSHCCTAWEAWKARAAHGIKE